MKLILSLLLLFTSQVALADAPLIWKGRFGAFLSPDGWELKSGKKYIDLVVDPTAGAGVAAPIGSLGVRNNGGAGEIWIKTGAADTAWYAVVSEVAAVAQDLADHLADTAGAHAASAISNTPSGNLAATDVQGAVNELQTENDSQAVDITAAQADADQALLDAAAAQQDIDDHIADAADAHAGSAITNTPSGNLAATDVQGALNELQTENDTQGTAITAAQGDATQALADAATAQSAADAAQQTADDHIADTTGAHAASAISNAPTGNLAATDVQGALDELQTESDGQATDIAAAQGDADQALLDAADAQTAADAAQTDIDDHVADTTAAHAASAISNTPSGSIAATDAQAAIDELDTEKQPLDADLTALSALSGTNDIYYRSAADTWSSVTVGTGLDFTGGTLSATAEAPSWGDILGTLSDQTDLQAALDLKAPLASPTFTGTVTSPDFAGDLTGNVAGDLTGNVTTLTTKGDLLGSDGADNVRVAVGENGTALVADASQTSGLTYAAQTQRKNWLVNESFEYATATSGWTTSGTFTEETTAENVAFGKKSLKFPSGAGSVCQSVTPDTFLNGRSMQHTAWVKTNEAIQVCSYRNGSSFECKNAPADGAWHEVGFTYTDPGTAGTRGICVTKASGTGDSYVDAGHVGPYEPNVPAMINVGGTFVAGINFPTAASCNPQLSTSSISFTDFPVDSDCATPTGSNLQGSAQAPSTKIHAITIPDLPASNYNVVVNGWLYSASGRPCHFRVSDGTDASDSVAGVTVTPIPSASFFLKRTSNGSATIRIQATGDGAGGSSGTCEIGNDSANRILSIKVYKAPDANTLAGAIITDEPWYYLSSKSPTRVTGSAPDQIGEYRSFLRQASASTFTETNGAPSTAPSPANGFWLRTSGAFSSGDASGNPSRYDFYIPPGSTYQVEYYYTTGRTGGVDTRPFSYTSVYDLGVQEFYDPSTGVLILQGNVAGGNPNPRLGVNDVSGYVQTLYFDVKVFSNPLAAGLATATDIEKWSTGNGAGSTKTYVRRFANRLEKKGDATTCTDDSTNGFTCLINKDGWYSIQYTDIKNVNAPFLAITDQTMDGATANTSLTDGPGILGLNEAFTSGPGQVVYSGPLTKGTIVKPHVGTTSFDDGTKYARWTISKAPSPFEIAGGAGSSGIGPTPYTVSIRGGGSNPAKGTVATDKAWYSCANNILHVSWSYRQTAAGSTGSGDYFFSLPSGFAPNTSVQQTSSSTANLPESVVGRFDGLVGGSTLQGYVYLSTSGDLGAVYYNNAWGSHAVGSANTPMGSGSPYWLNFVADIPVTSCN